MIIHFYRWSYFTEEETRPWKGNYPNFTFSAQRFSGHSVYLLVSSILGPRSRISKPTLLAPQPDPTTKHFCFEKQSFFLPALGWPHDFRLKSLTPLISTRQGLINTSGLCLTSSATLNGSISILSSFGHLQPMTQLPYDLVLPGAPIWKILFIFPSVYSRNTTFQRLNSISSLAPEHSSVAPKSLFRLYFDFFIQKAWSLFLCCAESF